VSAAQDVVGLADPLDDHEYVRQRGL